MELLRLFPATTQFELKNGLPNTGGRILVYFEGTDDLAPAFDVDGSQLPQPVILDADGRAPGYFVDAAYLYRLEVQDAYGALLWTVRAMAPSGGGAGSQLGKEYSVISSDGTVVVTGTLAAGVMTYDLSTKVTSDAAQWGYRLSALSVLDGGNEWEELQGLSTQGSVEYDGGWKATADCCADIAVDVSMPSGNPTALCTVDIMAQLSVGGTVVATREGMLDPTEPVGSVSFAWKGELVKGQTVDCRVYARAKSGMTLGLSAASTYNEERDGIVGNGGGGGGGGTQYIPGQFISIDSADVISVTGVMPYSGMGEYAKKTYVESSVSSKLDATAAYTPAFGWDSSGSISSIDGSAVAGGGGVDSSTVSSIASSYAASAASSKLDATASSMFVTSTAGLQPSGDYAYNSSLSSKLDSSAAYSPVYGWDASGMISSLDGSAIAGHDTTATGNFVRHDEVNLAIGDSASAYNTAFAQGVNVWGSAGGFVHGRSSHAAHASIAQGDECGAVVDSLAQGHSAYAGWSSLAQGYDVRASERSLAQGASNRAWMDSVTIGSGNSANEFCTLIGRGLRASGYIPEEYYRSGTEFIHEHSGDVINGLTAFGRYNRSRWEPFAIGDGTADSARHDLMVVKRGGEIVLYSGIADTAGFPVKESILSVLSATSVLSAYVPESAISSLSASWNEVSAKLDESAFSSVSGTFLTAIPAEYATTGYVDSSVSGKLDESAFSAVSGTFLTSVDLSDYATTAYVDSSVSSKLDTTAFSTVSSTFLTGVDLSDYVTISSISAESSTWNGVSAKLDESAFSSVSGTFLTAVPAEYATTGYVDSSVSGKLDSTAFSDVSGTFLTAVPAEYATTGYVDSSVSSKLDSTAFSDVSGTFLTAVPAEYATTGYVDSSVSSKLDSTAFSDVSGTFLTSVPAEYATTGYVDSSVSGKLDSTAFSDVSGTFLTSVPAEYATTGYVDSSVSGKLDSTAFSDVSGTFLTAVPAEYATTGYVDSSVSSKLDSTAFSTVSSTFLTSVDLTPYQTTADMSGYLQTGESANYYPASNPSGFITGVDLTDYATTAYVVSSVSSKLDTTAFSTVSGMFLTSVDLSDYATTAYVDSSVSGKLDSTAFDPDAFYPSGNPSGFITGVDLSDYATTAYVDSSVSGKLDATAFNTGDFYSTSNPSGFITGVDLSQYQTTSDMSGYLQTGESANYYPANNPSGFITGVDLSDYATTAYVDSSVSGKLDSTAFNTGDFYSTSNPSGFITGVDLSDYATTAYVDSSVSSKLDSTATGDFYSTSNPSGFITASYSPTFGYDGTAISSIDGSALAGGGGVDSSTVSAIASAYAESAASSRMAISDLGSSNSNILVSGGAEFGVAWTGFSGTQLGLVNSMDFFESGRTYYISGLNGCAVYDLSAQDGITALSAEIGDINTILQSI
jgi:hypothetical protein